MTTTIQTEDLTIHRIIEQETSFLPIHDFLTTLSPERLAENRDWLLAASGLDDKDWLRICFQSYVVRTPHHVVLVDTCIGNHKDRPTRPTWHLKNDTNYIDGLAKVGLTVDDIDYVMCTHLHPDHVGWNTRLLDGRWVPTFPNARYLFGRAEYAHWEARNAVTPVPYMVDSVLPVMAAGLVDLVASDHALGDHIRLLPTPGHTPDHFAVRIGKGHDAAVVTGDLIHSPLQARYPELSMMADSDQAASAVTRRAFLERYCDTDTLCCTAHFPSPSVGRIKRWGDGFRCEPL